MGGSVCLNECDGHYWLTLNRPKVLNAFDEEMLRELVRALETVTESGQPLIITGAGRAFCTGGDLKAYFGRLDDQEALLRYFLVLADVFEKIVDYPGVTVAAVNGVAVAGGLELMCACDLAVAA
ncbi:MAG: enoyl-CoA hydratase/isomerase family protein, partial [Acidobacteriaceae bacterium]|nr:enoyl-CoA hydratase/isomerase family protein [Acidobacteriaceae bacterium]